MVRSGIQCNKYLWDYLTQHAGRAAFCCNAIARRRAISGSFLAKYQVTLRDFLICCTVSTQLHDISRKIGDFFVVVDEYQMGKLALLS